MLKHKTAILGTLLSATLGAGAFAQTTTAPADTTSPAETTVPADNAAPADATTTPPAASTTAPADGTAPADTTMPADTTAPSTTTAPADTLAPTDPTVPADTTAPADTMTAPADTMTSPADCEAQFITLDADANGFLSETEAPREYARSRVDSMTLQETGLSREEYLSQCSSEEWTENAPEQGAPFEGANSFTEQQARDRAVAWNVTDVSTLVLDDQGIWRGEGKVNGAAVSVAIDYKGNVVTSPKM
ncbi:MAG: hypothetical protein JWS10_1224 [Cypionkella sp.]|uniref:hypothetical protein n=1 Tax=Cypionkella sp. TaxID=2811411 RepID=UPI002619AAB9|nr:hypothetical protein [Cypionkella sp.]MDB5658609.1 hypothetical protein [Cypionkella sp.]